MDTPPEPFWKQVLGVFAVCAVVYFGGFYASQYWRQRRGPWEVTFSTTANGVPEITMAASRLGIAGVQMVFPGTNLPGLPAAVVVRFDGPSRRAAPPFGSVKFLDTTVLPGTVTLDLFGHEVELLPRTLIVDKREHPWSSGQRIELPAR